MDEYIVFYFSLVKCGTGRKPKENTYTLALPLTISSKTMLIISESFAGCLAACCWTWVADIEPFSDAERLGGLDVEEVDIAPHAAVAADAADDDDEDDNCLWIDFLKSVVSKFQSRA